MFNDKYGLTEAVLSGRKTQTRRTITCPKTCHGIEVRGFNVWRRASDGLISEICMFDDDEFSIDGGQIHPKYKIGEIVAIAQSYDAISEEISNEPSHEKALFYCQVMKAHYPDETDPRDKEEIPGWYNKMFVKAELMPHQIRITNVRVERLQAISDEDVLKEGFSLESVNENMGNCLSHWEYRFFYEDKLGRTLWFSDKSAQESFSRLIDNVSGRGTWESNPFVFVYDFEIVK